MSIDSSSPCCRLDNTSQQSTVDSIQVTQSHEKYTPAQSAATCHQQQKTGELKITTIFLHINSVTRMYYTHTYTQTYIHTYIYTYIYTYAANTHAQHIPLIIILRNTWRPELPIITFINYAIYILMNIKQPRPTCCNKITAMYSNWVILTKS